MSDTHNKLQYGKKFNHLKFLDSLKPRDVERHLRATFYDIERSYNTVQYFLINFFQ